MVVIGVGGEKTFLTELHASHLFVYFSWTRRWYWARVGIVHGCVPIHLPASMFRFSISPER